MTPDMGTALGITPGRGLFANTGQTTLMGATTGASMSADDAM
jgi:hypothetical protein